MPTEAHPDVLYRELSVIQLKEFKPSPSALLQEVINFGTQAFIRCISSVDQEENVHLAPFALYRQILELTDGTEILVSNAAPAATIPLLRNTFEGLLSLEYILEDNDYYKERSLAWLAGYVLGTLRTYNSLIASTTEGENFSSAIAEDKSVRSFPLPPEEEVKKAIENLDRLLSREQFKAIIEEYNRYKRTPHWYSLFGGSANLYELCRHLKRTAQYEVLYRGWSLSAHAYDFRPFIMPGKSGESGIRGLRDLSSTFEVTTFTVTFIIEATRLLIQKYHPGEDWSKWYFREVRDAYVQFAKSYPHR
jgi:hypothetical protein